MPIIAALLSFLTGWFARFLGAQTIRIIIFKILAWTLVTAVLPTVLYNILSYLLGQMMTLVNSYVSGSNLQSFTYEFTGLGAWLAGRLKIVESFAVVMSACIFRMTINMIPFVGRL